MAKRDDIVNNNGIEKRVSKRWACDANDSNNDFTTIFLCRGP